MEDLEGHAKTFYMYCWRRLLEGDDHRALWKAINWNGSTSNETRAEEPSDQDFRDHFESLLNIDNVVPLTAIGTAHAPHLLLTDDAIDQFNKVR